MTREKGFSLLELLVAMTVTLIILAATLSLFTTALQTNDRSTQLSNLNGNLRTAMNLIVRDLLVAGQGIPTGGVPLPIKKGGGGTCKNINRPMPVGFSATFPYGCPNALTAPNMPAVIPGNILGPKILTGVGGSNLGSPTFTAFPNPTSSPNSDMITMMYLDPNLVTDVIVVNGQPNNNFLQTLNLTNMTFSPAVTINTSPSNAVNVGDIFMIYGGGLYRYVVVTATVGQTVTFTPGTDAFQLNQQPTSYTVGCGTTSGTLCDLEDSGVAFGGTCTYAAGPPPSFTNTTPSACATTAQRVLMISYFLDGNTIINNQIIPKLMRQINLTKTPALCSTPTPPPVGCPQPVAEVIEALEFSYDYVNGTTPITNQVSTPAAPAGITDNQIRKVNVFVGGRSDILLSPTEQFTRSNVATQVDIRSLAFINRYQ